MHIQAVTISVKSLEKSRPFYEDTLGSEPAYATEEPYRWQAYKSDEEAFFALIEIPDLERRPNMDIVNFVIDDVEQLWEKVKDQVTVELEPHMTPYGAYKFIIEDPDGFRLGFVTEDYEAKKNASSA
ncbi:MAG: VOC family protein [Gemmatimonadetes bacterium]|nr:VOC family protein [Gemmatimonadota bacterium]